MAVLKEAAAGVAEVLSYPAPTVLFKEFGDSALVFEVRVWIKHASLRDDFSSDVRVAIRERLAKEGIVIPFPQRDVHVVNAFPDRRG
jgi:small-conductance mechanosensitive channel